MARFLFFPFSCVLFIAFMLLGLGLLGSDAKECGHYLLCSLAFPLSLTETNEKRRMEQGDGKRMRSQSVEAPQSLQHYMQLGMLMRHARRASAYFPAGETRSGLFLPDNFSKMDVSLEIFIGFETLPINHNDIGPSKSGNRYERPKF